jgi:hypothetical protein
MEVEEFLQTSFDEALKTVYPNECKGDWSGVPAEGFPPEDTSG